MAMRKKRGIAKRLLLSVAGLVFVFLLACIADNRILAARYNRLDTRAETLSPEEAKTAGEVLGYLAGNGDALFEGFGGSSDLILFNNRYSFLLSEEEVPDGWLPAPDSSVSGKRVYRKAIANPQAFAVQVGNEYVGSMGTLDTFNQSMVNELPFFIPPQILISDTAHYRGLVLHEMLHARQANLNPQRFRQAERLHDICSAHYPDKAFNERIVQEAAQLEKAIGASSREETLAFAKHFLTLRSQRRDESGMKEEEIRDEAEFEWLEGLARYVEYKTSRDSRSLVARNLGDVDQKVRVLADDRYYTLGMAQALVLDILKPDWKQAAFSDVFTLESAMVDVCRQESLPRE